MHDVDPTFLSDLEIFASRFSITDRWVIKFLPAAVQRMAWSVNMGRSQFLAEATFRNHDLGEYIVQVVTDAASLAKRREELCD